MKIQTSAARKQAHAHLVKPRPRCPLCNWSYPVQARNRFDVEEAFVRHLGHNPQCMPASPLCRWACKHEKLRCQGHGLCNGTVSCSQLTSVSATSTPCQRQRLMLSRRLAHKPPPSAAAQRHGGFRKGLGALRKTAWTSGGPRMGSTAAAVARCRFSNV